MSKAKNQPIQLPTFLYFVDIQLPDSIFPNKVVSRMQTPEYREGKRNFETGIRVQSRFEGGKRSGVAYTLKIREDYQRWYPWAVDALGADTMRAVLMESMDEISRETQLFRSFLESLGKLV